MTARDRDWFAALTRPRSIAVVGASDDPSKISGRPLSYLLRFGYAGAIHPVNDRRESVQGLATVPSVAAIGAPVDLAIVCVPADAVVPALEDCARAGVLLAVVFASGFAEAGESGAARQAALAEFVAREPRMRVLGPNSLGLLATGSAVAATFTSAFDLVAPLAGSLGIVSQSGAFGAFIVSSAQAMGLGVRTFVSTGNESDLSLPEVVEAMAADPEVSVLLLYVEGLRDGPAFRRAVATARAAGKPVLAVKVGRSERGARAAALHTGAMTGADRAYDTVLAEDGVVRVTSLEDLLDAAQVLADGRRPAGNRLSVITISGGGGIMMADQAEESGLELAGWEGGWRERLEAAIPAYGSAANPIDVTAELIYRPELLEDALALCAEHPGTDAVAVLVGNVAAREDRLIEVIAKTHRSTDKPIVVAWIGGSGLAVGKLREAGVPAFADANRAVAALGAQWRAVSGAPGTAVTHEAPVVDEARRARALRLLQPAIDAGAGVLDEVTGKALLALYGVPVPGERRAAGPDDAAAAAAELGFPVALKLVSATITHKDRIGGVRLGLGDAERVRAEAADVLRLAAEHGDPGAGLVVQQMARPGMEFFVGLDDDPTFGPAVVAGAGGTHVELLDDSAMATAPLDAEAAAALIGRLRHAPLLAGWGTSGPRDAAAMADAVAAISRLGVELRGVVAQLDVNPVIVGAAGEGVMAVDCLVALR